MSSEMNLSAVLQSELYKAPAQIVIIDACGDASTIPDLLSRLHVTDAEFVDLFRVKDYLNLLSTAPKKDAKAQYTILRKRLLDDFLAVFRKRHQQGSKERCIIIVVADIRDALARTCLVELPIDASNLFNWHTSHLPSILRFATCCSEHVSPTVMSCFKQILEPLRTLYFDVPRFVGESASSTSQNGAAPSQTPSIHGQWRLYNNPYDVVACSPSMAPLEQWFEHVLKLHKMETEYVAKRVSNEYGSGGSLYLVEGKLVSSVCGWRRVDWLVTAQANFFPRFWHFTVSDDRETDDAAPLSSLEEFMHIFDFRYWISRFDGLEENDQTVLDVVTYPDSDVSSMKRRLKKAKKLKLQRRKREGGWTGIESATSLEDIQLVPATTNTAQASKQQAEAKVPSSASTSTKQKATQATKNGLASGWKGDESESNIYRITSGDYNSFRELVVYLNREARFSESLEVIRQYVRVEKTVEKVLPEFDKLEGIALLGTGDKENAVKKLTKYKNVLEAEEEDRRLLGESNKKMETAQIWAEVSGVYSACGEFLAAQTAAINALRLDAKLMAAQKTLVLALGRTGESSFEIEDLVFAFFASSKGVEFNDALEYYRKRSAKFPNNGYFWYGYAMFTFVLARDMTAANSLFEKANAALPSQARIVESYATFLFQSRSPKVLKIKELYEEAMELDPTNLILCANSCAFLLFFHSSQLAALDKSPSTKASKDSTESYPISPSDLRASKADVLAGFDEAQSLLESVIFSASLVDKHPQVYLECWFYVLCYTMEQERTIQALQYIKAALRKGIRARNWEMAMHVRFLRGHGLLSAADGPWIATLLEVIGDHQSLDTLDNWPRWKALRSDQLVSNLKLAPHSFKVCVSPSKRRDHIQDGASNGSKSKTTDTSRRVRSAPVKVTSGKPNMDKVANDRERSESAEVPSKPLQRTVSNPGEEEEDDMLSLLDTSPSDIPLSSVPSTLSRNSSLTSPTILAKAKSDGSSFARRNTSTPPPLNDAFPTLLSKRSTSSTGSNQSARTPSPSSLSRSSSLLSSKSKKNSPSPAPAASIQDEAQSEEVWKQLLDKYKDPGSKSAVTEVIQQGVKLPHSSPPSSSQASATSASKSSQMEISNDFIFEQLENNSQSEPSRPKRANSESVVGAPPSKRARRR